MNIPITHGVFTGTIQRSGFSGQIIAAMVCHHPAFLAAVDKAILQKPNRLYDSGRFVVRTDYYDLTDTAALVEQINYAMKSGVKATSKRGMYLVSLTDEGVVCVRVHNPYIRRLARQYPPIGSIIDMLTGKLKYQAVVALCKVEAAKRELLR